MIGRTPVETWWFISRFKLNPLWHWICIRLPQEFPQTLQCLSFLEKLCNEALEGTLGENRRLVSTCLITKLKLIPLYIVVDGTEEHSLCRKCKPFRSYSVSQKVRILRFHAFPNHQMLHNVFMIKSDTWWIRVSFFQIWFSFGESKLEKDDRINYADSVVKMLPWQNIT